MNEAAERISRYLLMQLGAGLCFGIPFGIGLAAIGIPNAPLWGMLGVVFRFVPYIGGPMTAVFPITLAIAVDPGWGLLLWTVLLFAAIELIVANVVETLIYSRSTGLSALAVVAAALFWTWLWGIVGLLLATPITVCLVVLGRYIRPLQFLDILLGNRPVLSPQESLYQRLLAHNPEEATEQAEEFARETSIAAFFDTVAIPALAMAQADTDRGVLTPHQRAVIAEGFSALLDNLAEDGIAERRAAGPAATREDGIGAEEAPIAIIAARNELDLAASWLLEHLLRQRGYRAAVYRARRAVEFRRRRTAAARRLGHLPVVAQRQFGGATALSGAAAAAAGTAGQDRDRLLGPARRRRFLGRRRDRPPPPPTGSSPACPTRWPRSRRRWPGHDGAGENMPDGSGLKALTGP